MSELLISISTNSVQRITTYHYLFIENHNIKITQQESKNTSKKCTRFTFYIRKIDWLLKNYFYFTDYQRMASKRINLFEKGGKIYEDHVAFGCDAKCVRHMFVSVCVVCNNFMPDYQIQTHSLRLASLHFKKHSKCYADFACRGPQHGGYHYCQVVENGKSTIKFPSPITKEIGLRLGMCVF